MRKFYIENELGQKWDLQDPQKTIQTTVNGIGFAYSNDYFNLGSRFVKNRSEITQKSIEFKLLVRSHIIYKNFIDFILSGEKYKLVYDMDGNVYYIDIDILEVSKNDIIKNDYLTINFKAKNTSLFYKRIEKVYIMKSGANENRWDVKFEFKFEDNVAGTIDAKNNGQISSGFKVEIDGYTENPSIIIIDKFGVETVIPFRIQVGINEKLLFSTLDDDLYAVLQKPSGTVNILNSLDFTKDNFVKLKTGENTVKITGNVSSAKFILYEGYISI
ncbi:MAG: hypothetical protein RR664_06405 [Clostridia bacterium]